MTQTKTKETSATSRRQTEAKNAAEALKNEGAQDADTAKSSIENAGEAAKHKVAAQAQDTSTRVREAGDAFGDGSFAQVAATQIADNLSSAADAVRGTDLGDLQSDVTEFARRNPALFLGGAAALGFVLARAAKASAHAKPASHDPHHTAVMADLNGEGHSA